MKKKKENPLNNLSGKEWLKFQKSWFKYEGREKLYLDNVRFFTKINPYSEVNIGITPHADSDAIESIEVQELYHFQPIADTNPESLDYVFIDLLNEYHVQLRNPVMSVQSYLEELSDQAYRALKPEGYLTVFVRNQYKDNVRAALAFETARVFKQQFSIRDEKIGCPVVGEDHSPFYCLHFRKKGV